MDKDLIAETDQAQEAAKHTASVVASFYKKLIEENVDVTTARYLTQKYNERLINVQ